MNRLFFANDLVFLWDFRASTEPRGGVDESWRRRQATLRFDPKSPGNSLDANRSKRCSQQLPKEVKRSMRQSPPNVVAAIKRLQEKSRRGKKRKAD